MDPFKLEKANNQWLKRAKTKALKVENRRKIQPLLVKENKEKKSVINKHFYKENKDSILEKKFCDDCKKFISAVNLKKHKESKTIEKIEMKELSPYKNSFEEEILKKDKKVKFKL